MTEPERLALDHIRRVVDTVLGELPGPQAAPSVISEPAEAAILPVPYLSQLTGEKTVNDSGAVAGTMLVRAYAGSLLTPAEFLNQAGEFNEVALTLEQIAAILKANGVPVAKRTALKLSDLVLTLFSGRPAIVPVRQVVLQQAGLTGESFDTSHHLVCVGLDTKYLYAHDPLRRDASGKALPIPWLTFYRAWSQASGLERVALIPRQQLLRRVKVSTASLNICQEPNPESLVGGTAQAGDVFEVSVQRDGWGKIGTDRWINLASVTDL